MKNYIIPRTMESAQWAFDADPIEHYPESWLEKVYGYLLALVIGIGLSAALVAWWTA